MTTSTYPPSSPTSVRQAYFHLTPNDLASVEFDIVIVGSGLGGGVLAADLYDKLSKLPSSPTTPSSRKSSVDGTASPKRKRSSSPDRAAVHSPRILLIERGGVPFLTHCANVPALRRARDAFKREWAVESRDSQWQGSAVYALGGRTTVWDRRAERLSNVTLARFPAAVAQDLRTKYYQRAEERLRVAHVLPSNLASELNSSDCNTSIHWDPVRLAMSASGGAFSVVGALVSAVVATHEDTDSRFRVLLNTKVERLEPPAAGAKLQAPVVTRVVVRGADGLESIIRTRKVVLCAGAVETAAILLRSASTIPQASVSGRLTVQRAYTVSMPFVARDVDVAETLYGTKLRTSWSFDGDPTSSTCGDVELALSAPASANAFPLFRMTFALPSELVAGNSVSLGPHGEPVLRLEYAADPALQLKRAAMVELAAQTINTLCGAHDLIFLKQSQSGALPLTRVSTSDLPLVEAAAEHRAVEVGTAAMSDALDSDLRLKAAPSGTVYVCDTSVFPFAPSTPPGLTLAALALRLSDHLLPPTGLCLQPLPTTVWNFTKDTVWVTMSLGNPSDPSFGPTSSGGGVKIKSGAKDVWGRVAGKREMIFIRTSLNAPGYSLMEVAAGRSVWITRVPPP